MSRQGNWGTSKTTPPPVPNVPGSAWVYCDLRQPLMPARYLNTKLLQQTKDLNAKHQQQARDLDTKLQQKTKNLNDRLQHAEYTNPPKWDRIARKLSTAELLVGFTCQEFTLTEFRKHQAEGDDGSWYMQ